MKFRDILGKVHKNTTTRATLRKLKTQSNLQGFNGPKTLCALEEIYCKHTAVQSGLQY